MKIGKKKSSLALALMASLTVVVGVAWAAGATWPTGAPNVFNYSNTYTNASYGGTGATGGDSNYYNVPNAVLPNDYTSPGTALVAGVGPAANMGHAATWESNANGKFDANKLAVGTVGSPVTQGTLTFASVPNNFEKRGAGKLVFTDANVNAGSMTTTVSSGTLEIKNNGAIGTGSIIVEANGVFVANGSTMISARPIVNKGMVVVTSGRDLNASSTTESGHATIDGDLYLESSAGSNVWKITGATTGKILPASNLTLAGENSGFSGKIVPASSKTLTAQTATALGAGTVDLASAVSVTVNYDTTVPAGTVATKFNAGSNATNTINFNTASALVLTGDSRAFNGTANVNAGAVTLFGAQIGTGGARNLAIKVAADKTLTLANGAAVHTNTATLGVGSVLRFDLTGAAPTFDASTLVADSTSTIDIVLSSAPSTGMLNFNVGTMGVKPRLALSSGFTGTWSGNEIRITGTSTANITPTSDTFDIDNPTSRKFILGADALLAAQRRTLSVYIDGVALAPTHYLVDEAHLTIFSTHLKTLFNGLHTITLRNGTTNVGTVALTVKDSREGSGSSSSGCNAGMLPLALLFLAPLVVFYKKD